MPYILELLNYIIYITSHDVSEPLHIHIISRENYSIPSLASKLRIGVNGETKIAKQTSDISTKDLKEIQELILHDPSVFNSIKSKWCEFFNITKEQIEFYKNVNKKSHGMRR